jgi:hypothetical protein
VGARVEKSESEVALEKPVEEPPEEISEEEIVETKEPALVGVSENLGEEETPVGEEEYTVVPSYVRRKKPKNLKNWWEGEFYENPEPALVGSHLGERIYLGHKLLPPQIGGNI